MTQRNDKDSDRSMGVDASLTRHGGLTYLEIPAIDIPRSEVFYQKVLGWKADGPKFSDPAGMLIGRWVIGRAISREPGLLPFIYVDRVDEAVKQVAELGGEIVKPPYAEGNLRVAVVRDPSGNTIGLWQDANR